MTKKSQKESILEYLESGHSITQMEALNLFGCSRLAPRIGELRKDGYQIESKPVRVKTRSGSVTVSEYRLDGK